MQSNSQLCCEDVFLINSRPAGSKIRGRTDYKLSRVGIDLGEEKG